MADYWIRRGQAGKKMLYKRHSQSLPFYELKLSKQCEKGNRSSFQPFAWLPNSQLTPCSSNDKEINLLVLKMKERRTVLMKTLLGRIHRKMGYLLSSVSLSFFHRGFQSTGAFSKFQQKEWHSCGKRVEALRAQPPFLSFDIKLEIPSNAAWPSNSSNLQRKPTSL